MISYRSIVKRIQSVSENSKITSRKPLIGGLYTYMYNPKTKERMKFYDMVPLSVPIEYTDNGFYGLNFHYLDLESRNKLLNIILPFNDGKRNATKMRTKYPNLVALAKGIWSACCKRYLWTHIRTKFVAIPVEDWNEVIQLPVISFHGSSSSNVYKSTRRLMKK